MWTVAQLGADLAAGKTSSRELVEQALARIADKAGEGGRAFIKVYAESARAEAEHADRLRKSGVRRSPVEGLPVSLKDLFDVAGDVTRAGSKIFADNSPARADAPAVAQADGMCVMALGSDTRGSIRQPAALCGVAGFKPTARRVPREGAFPLSYTLDSVGPLANSVMCCAAYDAVLSGESEFSELPIKGLRLLLPRSSAIEDLDREVERAFNQSLERLRLSGALIIEVPVPAFDRQAEYFKSGGIAGAEVIHVHKSYIHRAAEYDPRIGKRIAMGSSLSGADYVGLVHLRAQYIREVEALAAPFDAIVMPTSPCIAPPIAETERSDDDYFRWNFRIMRNTGLVNFLDGCAATLPCHEPGTAPVGFMVCGVAGADRRILAVAAAVERALARA